VASSGSSAAVGVMPHPPGVNPWRLQCVGKRRCLPPRSRGRSPIPPHGHCRGAQIFYCGPFRANLRPNHKKPWILPILAIALMFGGLFILGQSSVLTPFIYTLF